MASDRNIRRLQRAIWVKFGLESVHLASENVNEFLRNERIWQWEVQTFGLLRTPNASLCYAWLYREDGGKRQIAIIRESNHIRRPLDAVRAHIMRTRSHRHNTNWKMAA